MRLRPPSAALFLCLVFALLAAAPAAGQGAPKKPVDPEKARTAKAELDAKKMKRGIHLNAVGTTCRGVDATVGLPPQGWERLSIQVRGHASVVPR